MMQGFGWAIAKALAEAGAEISLGVWVSTFLGFCLASAQARPFLVLRTIERVCVGCSIASGLNPDDTDATQSQQRASNVWSGAGAEHLREQLAARQV